MAKFTVLRNLSKIDISVSQGYYILRSVYVSMHLPSKRTILFGFHGEW